MITLPTYTTVNDTAFGPIRTINIFNIKTSGEYPPGSELLLDDNYSYKMIKVSKNGTELTVTTDYTFTRPNKLTFTSNLVNDDTIEVERIIHLTEDQINYYIDSAEAVINSKLNKAYTVPFTSTPDVIKTYTEMLARSFILDGLAQMDKYRPNEAELQMKNDMESFVMGQLKSLAMGEDTLPGVTLDEEEHLAWVNVTLDDSLNEDVV